VTVGVRQFAASGVATTTNPATATFGSAIEAGETVICVVAMVDGADPTNPPSDPEFGPYALVDSLTSGVPRRILIYAAENHPGGATQVTWTKAASGSGGIACWCVNGDDPEIADFATANLVDPGTDTDAVTSGVLELGAEDGVLLGLAWRDAAAGTFNYATGTDFTDSAGGLIWNSTARAEHRTVAGDAAATFTANDGNLDSLVAAVMFRETATEEERELTLEAQDAQDTAAAEVVALASVELEATDTQDTFAADVQKVGILTLVAQDSQDTVAVAVAAIVGFELAATDPQDAFAADVSPLEEDDRELVFSATDPADVFAGDASVFALLALAATDAPDTFAGEITPPCIPLDFDPAAPDVEHLEGVAFLDRYGRFAKSEETVHVVRLFYPATYCQTVAELSVAAFRALDSSTREALRNGPSGAGLVDTSSKSNA
jgi:hypothetical protein